VAPSINVRTSFTLCLRTGAHIGDAMPVHDHSLGNTGQIKEGPGDSDSRDRSAGK
jgi:hypothetical protein